MNYDNVDKALHSYYTLWPEGDLFDDATSHLDFERIEQSSILSYLKEFGYLIPWGVDGLYRISTLGKEVIDKYGGVKNYRIHRAKEIAEEEKIQKAKNIKILNDAKLSTWQVKTYKYVFGFAVIGVLYTIGTVIYGIIKLL